MSTNQTLTANDVAQTIDLSSNELNHVVWQKIAEEALGEKEAHQQYKTALESIRANVSREYPSGGVRP